MILLFIVSCLILALITLAIFMFINLKNNKNIFLIKDIENCKSPTITGLTINDKFSNIITSPKDKILIDYISTNDDIYATTLNTSSFQIINEIHRVFGNDGNRFILLFSHLFNIYIASPFRISSLVNNKTDLFDKDQAGFFFNEEGSFIISSLSPLVINTIDTNFKILNVYMNINWDNIFGSLNINSNPILINNLYWTIGSNDDYLIFIIFDFIQKKVLNYFSIKIDFIISYGLIYNRYDETFLIPIIKNNKIHIYKINKDFIFSNNHKQLFLQK